MPAIGTGAGPARVLLLCVVVLTSGCAWMGWGSSKKPAALPELKGANAVTIAWSASVGKSGGYLFVPGFGDKQVYAAGRDGSVYALSEEGGRIVTRLDAKANLTGGVGVNDDTVVVGSGKGDIIALDSAGRSLWKSSVSGEVLAPPTVASGNVIVRTADGRIVALNRIDGKRKWVFQRAAPALTLRTNASVLVNRGVIYAGYPGGKIIALELESGKPIWEAAISLARGATELERIADVAGLPVLDDTRICAAVYQGRTGCVETLNGNVLWSREISSADGVAIDAKHVYVADTAGNVFALDKTNGATVWKLEKLQLRDPGTPIVVKGKILIGDKDGLIHGMSADNGELIGRASTDGSRVVSLSANGDRVIAQTDKGGVFSIAVK
ncbi:MAG: outer membrane protein assembly factor BamB [Betaproteobacteria bacterium]